jgi:hypothetical protein
MKENEFYFFILFITAQYQIIRRGFVHSIVESQSNLHCLEAAGKARMPLSRRAPGR